MLEAKSKVCLILPTQEEVDLFIACLGQFKFHNVTSFCSAIEALEFAKRQQFDFFIVRVEMPDMNGLVMIQKLRMSGNYSRDVHLLVTNKLEPSILNLLSELDIQNVIAREVNKKVVTAKLEHLLSTEQSLAGRELDYRDARAALMTNNLELAQDLCSKLLKANPTWEKAMLLHGDIAAKTGDVAVMAQSYSEALTIDPKSAVAAHKLAHAWMLQGEFLKAANLLNSLTELNSLNIQLLENAGLSNIKIKNFDRAQRYAVMIHDLDESNRVASEIAVEAKVGKGDYSSVAATIRKTHEDRDSVVFLSNTAVRMAKSGDVEGAQRFLENSIAQLKESKFLYAFYYNLGAIYREGNALKKAIKSFEAALALNPEFERARTALNETEATLKSALGRLGKKAS